MEAAEITPGMRVAFWPHPQAPQEKGKVTRLSDAAATLVFVLFDGEQKPKACYPRDLFRVCGWCGHADDCKPGERGKSPHHRLCCLDRIDPSCLRKKEEA